MLKTKAILVMGNTSYRNGFPVRDLAEKVEGAVESALKGLDAEDIVDIKVNTQFTGVSGDQAFILILYKDTVVKEKDLVSETSEEVVRRGRPPKK
jgi:methionine aminopeptidase